MNKFAKVVARKGAKVVTKVTTIKKGEYISMVGARYRVEYLLPTYYNEGY